MKSLLTLLLTCLFLFGSNELPAQEAAQSTKGDQQLTSNYFDFYFINGYALAYKFSATENSALRLQLDFSRSFSDENSDGTSSNTQSGASFSTQTQTQTTAGDSKASNININLFFQYLLNIYTSEKGHAYVGAGPFLSYRKITIESSNNYVTTNTQSSTSTQNTNSLERTSAIGAGLIFGIEGYLTKSITVFAETQITGGKSWTKYEYNYNTKYNSPDPQASGNSTSSDQDNWYYNLTNIRIGLGISI